MCGARRLRRNQNRAARLLFFVLLLNLVAASSQGDHQEQVHVREGAHPSPLRRRAGAAHQAGVEAAALRAQVRRVRAGAAEGGVRPQCADYEPVGWKCKCGAAVFDP
ncbi:hypothetical protein PAHAL_5G507900 [Panicum hallii]|uniref:Epidermal patterning factor-like protein n=1 Tax=Panicum hallii TaxID=206008 RepID=A0A2T8IPA1_9POAL|nr:hypothetical protein PAHAL_5G507900 [Panicum hallii]